MKYRSISQMALAMALPVLWCQCGGGPKEVGAGEDKPESDPVELAQGAQFPEVKNPGDQIPGDTIAAIQKKTWGEVIAAVSDEPPSWEPASLDGSPDHDGVRANLVLGGRPGWVLFKVSKDSSQAQVVPLKLGEGETTKTENPDRIARGFAGFYAMETGTLKSAESVKAARAHAIMARNARLLKNLSMAAMAAALDNDGMFPAEFAGIVEASDLPGDGFQVTDPATGDEAELIYFSGLSDSSSSESMLFACPFANPDGTRTAAFVDTSVRAIPEDEYQARLERQQ